MIYPYKILDPRTPYFGPNCAFQIHSRDSVKEFEPPLKSVIFSINDPGCDEAPIKDHENIVKIHPYHFYDVERNIGSFAVVSDEIVDDIVTKFLEEYESGIRYFIIHCRAGISRSSAVGAALSLYINGNDEFFFNGRFIPNRVIYSKIISNLLSKGKEVNTDRLLSIQDDEEELYDWEAAVEINGIKESLF